MTLSLKEHLIFAEAVEDRRRRPDLKYIEKKAKDQVERVIVELNGNESGALSRLAARYVRLDQAIKVMGEKKGELNAKIKGEVEDLFAAEDVVLTRVIETVSFTMTVSKRARTADKVQVDYEAIAMELAALIPAELQARVDEITALYTKIIPQADKSPALSVKAKVAEGLGDMFTRVTKSIGSFVKKISAWAVKFDKQLASLKAKL